MNFDVYPILKDEYVDVGVITDVDSIRSLLASILPMFTVSIECDSMYVQIATDTWSNMDKDMKTLQKAFSALSFQVEQLSDTCAEPIQKWEY